MSDPQWWRNHDPSINGIFKGGGAKGLLYAGATQAVFESGRWFRAVAGSSAGAITATLIAAGLKPKALRQAALTGPAKLKRNWLLDLIGRPFIQVDRLRTWLEKTLAGQLVALGERAEDDETPVTFRALHEATGIELFVVAVDVVRRQPVVFSHATTPELSVTEAVVASSAIPVFFRAGRLEVQVDGQTRVHRLIDGGVWANYPAFVFKDRSFREHHGLGEVPEDTTTIGFTLEYPVTDAAPSPTRLRSDWVGAAGDRGAALKGPLRLLPVRWYLLTLIPLIVAVETGWTFSEYGVLVLEDNFADNTSAPGFVVSLAGFLDGWFSDGLLGFVNVMIAVGVIGLFALGSMFFAATLLDSAVPAMKSLMAVGTNVPYWVGTTAGDHVVRLTVPAWLGTLRLEFPPEQASEAIREACEEAKVALAAVFPAGAEETA